MPNVFLKFKILSAVILWLGLVPTLACATALGDFRRDLRLYRAGVEDLLSQYQPAPRFFLESMKREAEYLRSFAQPAPPQPGELDKRIAEFSRFRSRVKEREPVEGQDAEFAAWRQEGLLWGLLLEPYREESYLRRLVTERAIMSRRNYDFDHAARANFLERSINENVDFLQYRQEEAWYRQQGVPRFEANAGVEPFVLVEDGNPLGLIADIGLLYYLLPEVRQQEDNRYLAEPHFDGWWDRSLTRHVRKVGLRLGAGAIFDGPSPAIGVGMRLRFITLWGIYSSGDTEYSLAIGFSDLEWLEKINFVAPF